jgi:two-component system sensor histidine kinase UhpB
MLAQLPTGVPVWTALGWFITNTSEALIGAFCITRFAPQGKSVFDSVRGILIFVLFGVLIAPLATSFLDAAAVVLTRWGRGYWPLSAERFLTNALAALTIVPTIVLLVSNGASWIRKATRVQFCEAGLLAVATIVITAVIFALPSVSPATAPALLYAPLPLLLWAAIRFGSGGLSSCLLCIALIAIWRTIHGHEPFPYAPMSQNVLSLQILFCLVVVPLLLLSAVMAQEQAAHESLHRMGIRLIEAQERERHRIARDLHDDLGQMLALMQIKLEELMKATDESLRSGLVKLSNELSRISTTAHEISHGLYPSQLEYGGLASAVTRLCDDMRRTEHLSVDLAVGTLRRVKPSVSLCIYRVAQEALHNIISHSHARNVHVELNANDRWILLRVSDDGIGFAPRLIESGLGLLSMKDRVRSVGGSIVITSAPKVGTRIEVSVPFREDQSDDTPHAA